MVKFLIFKINTFSNFLFKKIKYNKNFFLSANSDKIIDEVNNFHKISNILQHRKEIQKINIEPINFNKKNQDYFTVDYNKMCSDTGKKIYHENFPLFKTALELCKNNFSYVVYDTYLYKYINSFKPQNYAQLFGINNKKHLFNKLSQHSKFYPWMHNLPQRHLFAGLFGPKEDIFIEMTIVRLTNLIKSIIKYSYKPSEDDVIMGYFLLNKNDYRFIITSGTHRTSVILALKKNKMLNLSNFICKFDNIRIDSNFHIINIENVKSWPAVKGGYMKENEALEHFNSYFS